MSTLTYVIIGNGVAGISAAQEIRACDPQGQIILIGDEGEHYYYRASLSEWISGDNTADMLPGRTPDFYRQLRIREITAHVQHVDPDARQVILESGEVLSYDRLLIATGARANTFPVAGLEEIQVFRTWADARQIKEKLGCCGRALILGGGILGLELAGALIKMGIQHIAVVQRHDFVGGPLLDKPAAEWLQTRMVADGVALFLNDTVEHVVGNDAGERVAHFKSGKTWPFDLFVQSVGITPVFPETPGLEVGRGIRIDGVGRTNLRDIYAAGDCTETYNAKADRWFTTRIWLDCARQGRLVGRVMTGQPVTPEDDVPFYNASIIYDTFYSYIGEPHGEESDVYLWQERGGYRKVRVVAGHLAGVLLLKERQGANAIRLAIGKDVSAYGDEIVRPDFPWNDLTGQDWDYLF